MKLDDPIMRSLVGVNERGKFRADHEIRRRANRFQALLNGKSAQRIRRREKQALNSRKGWVGVAALLVCCATTLADTSFLCPPGFKPVVMSPKLKENYKAAAIVSAPLPVQPPGYLRSVTVRDNHGRLIPTLTFAVPITGRVEVSVKLPFEPWATWLVTNCASIELCHADWPGHGTARFYRVIPL